MGKNFLHILWRRGGLRVAVPSPRGKREGGRSFPSIFSRGKGMATRKLGEREKSLKETLGFWAGSPSFPGVSPLL